MNIHKADVALSALDPAYIASVKLRELRQPLLREADFFPEFAYSASEAFPNRLCRFVVHYELGSQLRLMSPRTIRTIPHRQFDGARLADLPERIGARE